MVVKEKEEVSERIEWDVETEVQLFYAMIGHKPVGVNKHFQMAFILEKFRNALNKEVTSKVIWDHLDTMYDMQALDDTENLPFPNDDKDFSLPEAEFGELIEERIKLPATTDQIISENDIKKEPKSAKDVHKKEINTKDVKETVTKKEGKETKDTVKEVKKEPKEPSKEPKKISKDSKDLRRESKDSKDGKEGKKESKKDGGGTPKEVKTESSESKDARIHKQSRSSIKEKKENKKDETIKDDSTSQHHTKKDRVKDLQDSKHEDSGKRVSISGTGTSGSGKRSTRGSLKPDEVPSNKSSSPITVPTPPNKRRRT